MDKLCRRSVYCLRRLRAVDHFIWKGSD